MTKISPHSNDTGEKLPQILDSGPARNQSPEGEIRIERKRFKRIRWFFIKMLGQILLWDVIFSFPILRLVRPEPLRRWQAVARRYKTMATELGGVLIKLGQFLSSRVDLLPLEVTRELSGLQDKVLPEPIDAIIAQIEDDFSKSLNEIFPEFSMESVGAASLAQAHVAKLKDGTMAVVKVLRPGIDVLVKTDLEVMGRVCRWFNHFRQIRNRMNLDLLMTEFTATTMRELDMTLEKENIQRFFKNFKYDPHVYIPRLFEDYCASRTLTMEDVSYIKIHDLEALQECGIDCSQVADRLYNSYMKQVFLNNFIHVDPHPGNLFVRPLPSAMEKKAGIHAFLPGEKVSYCHGRPFQIVFIDFGMTAVISERVKTAMRVGAIGMANRDAGKMIQAYITAGVLQPGADLRRLEEAHQDWFQRVWGLHMGKLHEVAYKEARYFMKEYRDIITRFPFQLQSDMLFIGRAVGILAGMATHIDPEFDPWTKTLPYARRFAMEEFKADWEGWPEEAFQLGRHFLKIPTNFDRVLDKAGKGTLTIQTSLSPETRRAIKRIDMSVKRFSWMVLATGLLVSGVNLYIAGHMALGVVCIIAAFLVFIWAVRRV